MEFTAARPWQQGKGMIRIVATLAIPGQRQQSRKHHKKQ
jgi:hypothetical protein